MKKVTLVAAMILALLVSTGRQDCFATPNYTGSASLQHNSDYTCQPPYLTQSANPNIHFVLDYTGSMNFYPYILLSSTYNAATSFYGYFKQDVYYQYDTSTTVTGMTPNTGFWAENAACVNSDHIGTPNCVSGRLLNYLTSNKVDILRQVLTGGRLSGSTTDVLEHDQGDPYNDGAISGEATTSCNFDPGVTDGQESISSNDTTPSPTTSTVSNESNISVSVNTSSETFTRGSGSFTTDFSVGDTVTVSQGTSSTKLSSNNTGTFTISALTSSAMTVTGNLQSSDSGRYATFTKVSYTPAPTASCKVLAHTLSKTMTVSGSANSFTRTDGGSFLTDGWAVGMTFYSSGFRSISNNNSDNSNNTTNTNPWTIASVTASTITVTTSGLFTDATARSGSLVQDLAAYSRVRTTTPSTITGTIQYLYTAPGSAANKADIEISIFNNSYGVSYAKGTGSNTTKNQAQINYISAINGTDATDGTNTKAAMSAAQKFFQSDNSSTGIKSIATMPSGWPASGTSTKGNATYDPYYDTGNVAIPCRKSFVILATDGDWNQPGTSITSDPTYVAWDMHWNDQRSETTSSQPGYDVNQVGKQNVTTYAIYLLDSSTTGKSALKTVALFGGFNSIDQNSYPYPFKQNPPTSSGKYTTVANSTGWSTSLNITYPLTECNDPTRWDNGASTTCAEWDTSPKTASTNHTNTPYNYYEASDGDQVAASLLNAVNDILERVSSGTAASILGNNDNAGSQLLQAMFYPIKTFENHTKSTWLGELQSYWYFVDPTLKNITIREDTDQNLQLDLTKDRIVQFTFDGTYTKVNLYNDSNGDGVADSTTFNAQVDPENVNTLWQGGLQLFCRAESDRVIFTNDPTASTATKLPFIYSDGTSGTPTKLESYLDVSTPAAASDIIAYARGKDVDTSYRNRTVQFTTSACTSPQVATTYTNPWKLGDIINSTPKILTEVRLNSYNLAPPGGYADSSYAQFIGSTDYNARGGAYVGANDGMFHAFKTGSNFNGTSSHVVAQIKNSDGSTPTDLGKETWAFVPKNVLPYLQYLSLNQYTHMYFVDTTPIIADASINVTNGLTCSASTYSACALKTTLSSNQLSYDTSGSNGGTSWRTVLIGSMGMGGATRVNPVTTSGVALTVSSGGKTFHRGSGDFTADGWKVGKVFTAAGFANSANNSTFNITAVTATDITCSGVGLVTETGPATATLSESQAVKVPVTSPSTLGYSSVFAMDITQPTTGGTIGTGTTNYPQLLWEFSDPRLGFTTVTPAMLRIKDPGETAAAPTRRNGKWFAILASGPTGPISGGNFYGNSDMPLTIFVLDLKTGTVLRTFNNLASSNPVNSATSSIHTQVSSMPSYAFGGSLAAAGIDVDKLNINNAGNYSDDALYIGYTKGDFTLSPPLWNKGGVLRLLTYNDPDPSHWSISPVVDGIGPVTSAVTRLQDVTAHQLWLYFGTGRYFTKSDDPTNVQSIFGIKDPCYTSSDTFSGSYSSACTTQVNASSSATGASGSNLVDQSGTPGAVAASKDGWFINLGTPSGSLPKRIITDPIANYTGIVTFSAFAPSTDVCSYGGTTSVWEVLYNTGGAAPANLMGQLLIQLSTGAFQQVNLSTDFTASNGRETIGFKGTPPKDKPSVTSNANHVPSKRILHIRER